MKLTRNITFASQTQLKNHKLQKKKKIKERYTLFRIFIFILFVSVGAACWETVQFSEDHSFQKGLFRDRVLISPRTEKALAAAVTKLMAPMARVACGEKNN